jgi:multiple sugar transport system permease protein
MKFSGISFRLRKKLEEYSFQICLLASAIIAFLPFYWAITISIRNPIETFTVSGLSIPFIQFQPTLDSWIEELSVGEAQRALINSSVIALGTALGLLLLGTPAAYALARFRFRRPSNQNLTIWFLSQRVLPPIVTVVPVFMLMRQGFLDIPIELEEAALVDGANHGHVFWHVSIRLAIPCLMASMLISIAYTWNEFLFALTISSRESITVPVHMAGAAGTRGIQFWFVGVRVLIAMAPPVILALLAQRFIVRGLTVGALKG